VFRIQLGSIDLTSTSMLVVDAVKTASAQSTQAAEFTQSTQAVKTVDVLPVLDSIATSLTAAAKNATGTITLESAFASTALIGKIQTATTVRNSIGINLAPTSFMTPGTGAGSDAGPLLTLGTPYGIEIETATLNRQLLSIWITEDTIGYILDGNTETGFGTFRINSFRLGIESGKTYLYYYGNTAAEQVYPEARWIINFTESRDWHHYLIYIDLVKSTSRVDEMYYLFVDGEKQQLEYVTPVVNTQNRRHPMTISKGLALAANIFTVQAGVGIANRFVQQPDPGTPGITQF
jgi:hypothetical protein